MTSSPIPLTMGIPLEALRFAADARAAHTASPMLWPPAPASAAPPIADPEAPGSPATATPAQCALDATPATETRHELDATPETETRHELDAATMTKAWELAETIARLLGSGAPRSLFVQGPNVALRIRPPAAGSITTRRA